MANKCENCAEKCPQAERAHQAALGRMYATNEFTALLKKVESGELVEVVRCKKCEKGHPELAPNGGVWCAKWNHIFCDDGFCSYGERREGE